MKFQREIYLKLMGGFAAAVALLCVLMALNACATLDKHSAIVRLAVSQATMRYIEQAAPGQRVEKAQKILAVIEKVKVHVDSDAPVTIAELAQLAITYIPADLNPSDRALAFAIVEITAQELSNQVGQEVLPADARVRVSELLLTITSAASYFLVH